MIKLIINADDFGYSKLFNEKILELLKKGFIKSTTVMIDFVTKDQKNQVKKLIEFNKKSNISVGLHVVFNLEKPLYQQIEKQFRKFEGVFKFKPSHLDYHKFVGNLDCVNAINNFAEQHNLPVRHMEIKPKTKHTTHPLFDTTPFDLEMVIKFLDGMKDGESCEILCHPGRFDPSCKSSLNKEREQDYENILKLQEYLKKNPNIKNISYKEL